MYSPIDDTKRAVYGYHNTRTNKYVLINKGYPLVIQPEYQPFLITRDNIYTSSLDEIINLVKRYEKFSLYQSIKNKFANIAVIPGLIVSIIYLLRLTGNNQYVSILETIVSDKVLNTIFWFSTIGILILWHENFRELLTPKKLPKLQTFSEHELEQIRNEEIKFGRYGNMSVTDYFSNDIVPFLAKFSKKEIFSTYKILENVLNDEIVRLILKRADLNDIDDYMKTDVNKTNMPSYPVYALKSLSLYATEEALASGSQTVEPVHIFLALCKIFPVLNKYLAKKNSSLWSLREGLSYEQEIFYKHQRNILDPQTPYLRTNGLARQWVYGYTFVLSHFSKDIAFEIANSHETFGIGHQKEVDDLVSVIGRIGKRNALLIGDPGVGKSSMIKGLAQRINKGDVPPQLQNKRIIQLDLNGMIASSTKTKKLEDLIQKAVSELNKAGNTILYIDEIQELIPAKAQESGHSLASVLLPYITDSQFPVVGTTNYSNYKKYFYTNESFRQSFTNIELQEITSRETMDILKTKVPELEHNFNLFITISALSSAIELAQRYIHNRMLPDSAVDLLESTCSWAQTNSIKVLTGEHVSKVTSLQTDIEVESVSADDISKMNSLAEKIKERVIGEDSAVETIVETLKRSKTGLRNPNKPIGVFMFIGPTGVGKTHLAKVVAEEFFKNKNDIVRIDMSEYQEVSSISKILGTSSSQYDQTSISLLDKVKVNPYTIVLFDEIEKANPQLLDLFLQLFDEGRLTSNSGEIVDFTNTIIVCTSNIGSDVIMNEIQQNDYLWDDVKSKVLMKLKQSIRPELFNRFDSIVIFEPHTIDTVSKIAQLILQDLEKRVQEHGIELVWDKTIPMLIANKAYDPAMGARPIKRYIQEKIEGKIAQEMLDSNIKSGDKLIIKESWIN